MEVFSLSVCYDKLLKLLIEKGWKRKDLQARAQVSHNIMARLSKGEYINMESMEKICTALDCNIGDVMEFVPYKE